MKLGMGHRSSLKIVDFQLTLYLLYSTPVLWNGSPQESDSQPLEYQRQ